ncbi:Rmf/CrpP family protein [Glutamicibacter arilaitensis]|uniref:Rmf/CrpP family protein n=1 Tax=Glutamicibacter arilaitensis TaxID=256701 RepID=UPI003FCFA5C8
MSHTSISPAETLKIQQEGYAAYLQGIHIRNCPHPRDTPENTERQTAWFRGYAASRTDRARANRNATK